MKTFSVALDVKFLFDVDAENMDEAAEAAKHFFKTMKHHWGEGSSICWVDNYITKQSVSQEVEE